MSSNALIGTWAVTKCESVKGANSIGYLDKHLRCMEGVRVRLDENGDVTWTLPEELKSVPLFTCETYELHRRSGRSGIVLRFGAYGGHVFEFIPEKWSEDNVALTCEGLCTLHCVRVKNAISEVNYSTPFSLLPALEEGYFSDLTITSSDKKQFKIHSFIVELQGDDIDWLSNPPPFSNLSEDVLGTILHFLYAACLPENLTEDTARKVISVASSYNSLANLVDNCQLYLKNVQLKQQIISLMSDMHNCIDEVIDRFHTKNNQPPGENIVENPAKLCFVVKQSIRDAAVVGAKLLLLSDLFTKRKSELPRFEKHEIIRYAKSRLPIFMTQLTQFLQVLKSTFSAMTSVQRLEIATFLVPEIEVILDTIFMLILHIEKVLQQMIQGLLIPDVSKYRGNVGEIISKTVKLLHIWEITKLNTLHEHITFSLGLLRHKKEMYSQMTSSQKVRSIARNLEQLIEELPIFVIRLEETASAFEENLKWRDFKFCFKVGTSKVSDILEKLLNHTDTLQDVMLQLCELVQRDAFTRTLQGLGLLTTATTSPYTTEISQMPGSPLHSSSKHHSYKLNLVKSLCTPKDANNSSLSQLCLQLFESQNKTDMEFEVIGNNSEQSESDGITSEGKCIIKSHRVIMAARCDWFRRALSSGMREAIDKKIIVHDTEPFLFRLLLEYLYRGRLKQDLLSMEQLVDLLLLSDRYEIDTLKHTCEYALLKSIDADSVLYFLSVADQYNARILKGRCMYFLSQHHELTDTEEFLELPISLQAQIFEECVLTQPSRKTGDFDFGFDHLLSSSSAYSSDSGDITRAMETMLLTPETDHSNNSSSEDLNIGQNSTRLEACISQIRDIVGEMAPRETLVQVILAADFDLQRAVNYYYAHNNGDE